VADSVAKVADEPLRDNNGQQSNRKGLIFESTLRKRPAFSCVNSTIQA
jgi:hypothetical protein